MNRVIQLYAYKELDIHFTYAGDNRNAYDQRIREETFLDKTIDQILI